MSDEGKISPDADPVRYVQPVETADRTAAKATSAEAPGGADGPARAEVTGKTVAGALLRRLLDIPEGPAQDAEDQRLLAWIASLTRAIEAQIQRPLIPPRRSRPAPHRQPLSLERLPDASRFHALMQEVRLLYAALNARMPSARLSPEERQALRRQMAQARGLLLRRPGPCPPGAAVDVEDLIDEAGAGDEPSGAAAVALERLVPLPEQELDRRLAGLLQRWGSLFGPALPLEAADLRKMMRLAERARRFEEAMEPLEEALQRLSRRADLMLRFMRVKMEAMARCSPRLQRQLRAALRAAVEKDDAAR